jgi:hypothetical protein
MPTFVHTPPRVGSWTRLKGGRLDTLILDVGVTAWQRSRACAAHEHINPERTMINDMT